MPKVKALVLVSGGLDSMLTARLLMEQDIEVTGLVFISHFFGAVKARKAAAQLGIKLIEIDFRKEHLAMVKNPKHGYGKHMNPCIDCHTLMVKMAKEVMEKEGFNFVATGEILGQRPMSQNKEALEIVESESGVGDLLVRPMSAKLLPESRPEKEGKIIRGKLMDIKGRSRQKQLELVKKFGIKEYATPGGGCLLTQEEFSQRLIKMFDYWPECEGNDVELLKNGRIFWTAITPHTPLLKKGKGELRALIVVGRDKEDCENLEKLAQKEDIMVKLKEIAGPTTLIRFKNYKLRIKNFELGIEVPHALKMSELKLGGEKSEEEIINIAALLTGYYATKARGKKVKLEVRIKK